MNSNGTSNKSKKIIYFADLFAGVGGFHHAILNYKKNNSNIDFRCKLVSEIDFNAKVVYSKKFNFDINKIKDINDVEPKNDMKDIELVFCGFPCQTFSTAGKRKGFADYERGRLIFKVIEIIKKTKPKIVLLENVKHIISHDNGETFNKIISEFKKIGYKTTKTPIIISPVNLGIPQNRERVFVPFIYKTLENHDFLENIDVPNFKLKSFKKIIEKDVDKKYFLSNNMQNILNAWEEFVEYFTSRKIKIPVIWLDELLNKKYKTKSKAINKDWYKNYMNSMKKFYNEPNNKKFIDKWAKKHNVLSWERRRDKKLEWQAGFDTKFKDSFLQERQSGLRFKKNTYFPALVATVQTPIIFSNNKWRYLTPDEVAKLQCLPSHSDILSNNFQLYKQYGNSVNVQVVEWVINNYLDYYFGRI